MVKKSLIQRSLKKYKLSHKFLNKRFELKQKLKKQQNILTRFKFKKSFQILPKNSSFIRFNRFCFKTGRNHGYYRNFSLSRHILREMAHNSELPGLVKASW